MADAKWDDSQSIFSVTRARRWLGVLGVVGALLLLAIFGAALVVWLWMPNEQQLASDVELELQAALGFKVSVAAVRWQLLPLPAIVLSEVATDQTPPVSFKKLTLYPNLSAIFTRSLSFDLAELEAAVVPQLSLRELGRSSDADSLPGGLALAAVPLERFVFRDVTWITRRGIPVIYDGEVDFDEAWRPRTAQLRRPDYQPLTLATLERDGQQDQWRVNAQLGGGTLNGDVQLKTSPNGRLRLDGKLKPQAVEVASALEAFNRRPVLAGKANGNTILSADGANFVELVQSLRTQTAFAMTPATLLRFDMAKAVRSAGKDHTGQTALDSITGAMNTQNTPQGMVVNFKDIKARSGALSASGDATLANRRIDAEFAVDLVDGIVGVPLTITGPTDKVVVNVPNGALVGAVVGTAVLPVIGTALGARIGAALGKMLGSGSSPKNAPSPAIPAPTITAPGSSR